MSGGNTSIKTKWWKESVIYQIYPASFYDTNGDGWGDVPGITAKLDYLKDLGVDVIWTSPIYKSPQIDMGYDISDYEEIDPRYGSVHDVDNLIAELKKRGMKLVMDLVVNHTSDQHEWFLESRSSVDSPKRDWYIWKKPKYDAQGNRQPPNNWYMILGTAKSAWTWDERTQEYYLGLFTAEQPDLNWENPAVRNAVHKVLRFWLDRGVAGFRMDVINLISKDQSFPDAAITDPEAVYQDGHEYFANGPRLHEFLKEMNRKVLSQYDIMTVGEMPFVRNSNEILKIVGEDEEELNMIFNFEHLEIGFSPGLVRMELGTRDKSRIGPVLSKWQEYVFEHPKAWNTVFMENHDTPRAVSQFTNESDKYRELGAKLLCLLETTLTGTLFIFQGQELGMRNVPESWPINEFKDIETQNYWHSKKTTPSDDLENVEKAARNAIHRNARDHARTPVQWTAGANAGFCSANVRPWMKVNDDYTHINAEVQCNESSENYLSTYQFWKRGLENRKRHKEAFVYGDFTLLSKGDTPVFAYKRSSHASSWVIALNFSDEEQTWHLLDSMHIDMWVAGNYVAGKPDKPLTGTVTLKPWEGILGSCKE